MSMWLYLFPPVIMSRLPLPAIFVTPSSVWVTRLSASVASSLFHQMVYKALQSVGRKRTVASVYIYISSFTYKIPLTFKKKKYLTVNMLTCLCLVTQSCLTPWTVPHQTSLCMGFSRRGYWSGLPFPSPICVLPFPSPICVLPCY